MQPPPGYPHSGSQVCRLRRALYGLKQAPRAWFEKFNSVVAQQGFTSSPHDTALFARRSSISITLILLYVDDMIITGDDSAGIRSLQHFLSQHFEMKDLGILSYVKGTLYHGLHYSSRSSLELHAYSDADWAGDPTDQCSIIGFYFLFGTSLVSWHSKKQDVVSRSNTEAKYRVLADTTCELVWLRWLLADMDAPQPIATPLYCDNRSAIYIAHNDVFHEHTKHIEIDCHITRQHFKKGNLKLFFISSADQPTDIFTKTHPPGRLRDLIFKLPLASSLPPRV